ncbi:unnamed protein product [Protopolystoma xenopodis]|uniref:Uncharacterized protein n=1 Tax=Protopolystoma xenopodis TaxID=117903 RepID=A0A3S5BUZ6_9PLAT|nr:unnamed protein product [Protopolystoma xenopodis]
MLSLLEGSKLEPTSKIANEQAFIRKLLEPLLEAAEANLAFEAAEIQASSRSLRSNSVVGSSVSSASSVLSTGLLERQGSDAQALIRSAKLGLIAQREKLVASIRSEILTGWISRDHAKQHSAKQTQSLKPQRSRHEAFENQKSSGRRSHRQNIPREVSKSPAMKQAHNRS